MKFLLPLLMVLSLATPAEARIWKPLRYAALPIVVPYFAVGLGVDHLLHKPSEYPWRMGWRQHMLLQTDCWLNCPDEGY